MRGSLPISSHNHGLTVRTCIQGRNILQTSFFILSNLPSKLFILNGEARMVPYPTSLSITGAHTQLLVK